MSIVPITPTWTAANEQNETSGYAGRLEAFGGNEERAFRAGRWCQAYLFGNERARDWCKANGIERRVMNISVNTAGGYLAPDELNRGVQDIRDQFGIGRRFGRVVPMASDVQSVPQIESGPSATWGTETSETSAADLALGPLSLTAQTLRRLTRVSNSLIEDSPIDLAELIATDAGRAFADEEDDAIFNGDGTAAYGGNLGLRARMTDVDGAGNDAAGSVAAASGDNTLPELRWQEVCALPAVLPGSFHDRARWYVGPAFQEPWGQGTTGAAGAGVTGTAFQWSPGGLVFGGYPVTFTSHMPNSRTADYAGLCVALLGDMSLAVTIGSRRQLTVRRASERYAELDQTGIWVTERVAIVTTVGTATVAGPMAGLIATT